MWAFLWVLVFAGVSPLSPAYANTHMSFERFSDSIGGRQNSVYEIYRDEHDFLWFASDTDGLLRYDGYEFVLWSEDILETDQRFSFSFVRRTQDGQLWAATWGDGLLGWDHATGSFAQYRHDPQDAQSLANDRVQTLFEDSKGRLWVGTLFGLNYLESSTGNASDQRNLVAFSENHPLHKERIWRISESEDRLWVATTQGLFELTKNLEHWQQHFINPEGVGQNRYNEIRTLHVHQNRVWVGTDEGVFYFNREASELVHVDVPDQANYLSPVRVNTFKNTSIGQTGQSVLLVGTTDGLFALDTEEAEYRPIENGHWRMLEDVDIRTIEQDSSGGVWVGARDQSIFYTRNELDVFRSIADNHAQRKEELGLERAVFALEYGQNEELWLGISDGLLFLDPQTGEWERYIEANGAPIGRVETILQDSRQTLWVAANRSLYQQEPSSDTLMRVTHIHEQLSLDLNSITEIYETTHGTLLLGFWGIGLAEYNLSSGEAKWVLKNFEETQGDLVLDVVHVPRSGEWMVTRYSGLYYRSFPQQEWQAYSLPEGTQLRNDSFFCAYAWRANELWLCTAEDVWKLDTQTGEMQSIGPLKGGSRVTGMTHDRNNQLWMLSSQGLTRYNPENQSIVTFGMNDGLPATEFLNQAIDRSGNGGVGVGSVKGAFEFNPEQLSFSHQAPSIGLSRAWINGNEITGQVGFEAPKIELDSKDRAFTVQFSVLDFHDTSRNSIRYRLVGLNEQWSSWTQQRQLTFGSLSSGEYTLEVQGRNSFGIESKALLSIAVSIAEPWWRSVWAWLIIGTFIIVIFQGIFKWRTDALARSNQRLDRLVNERTQELELLNEQLKSQSETDYLTKLPNRRGFSERFKLLQAQAQRNGSPTTLVLCDVDNFKQFNDNYGHDAGDTVLKALGEEFQKRLRAQDVPARWGGEEFSILLANTDEKGAFRVCENLRKAVEELSVEYEGYHFQITATFGLFAAEEITAPMEHWMHCADIALYEGKRNGRNRVEVYTASMES